MTRTFRAFILLYALAMVVITIEMRRSFSTKFELWFWIGEVAVTYVVLTLGYLFSRNAEWEPSVLWLLVALGFIVSGLAAVIASDSPHSARDLICDVLASAGVLSYLGISIWHYLALRNRARTSYLDRYRKLALSALIAGIGCVLSSLFLGITVGDGTGLSLVLRKASWITREINCLSDFSGSATDWLKPVYGPGGHVIYLLALSTSLGAIVWLIASRASTQPVRSPRLFAGLTAAFTLSIFWIYTDIFWGWEGVVCWHGLVFIDASTEAAPWSAVLATALWLVAPLFALVLLVPLAWRPGEIWRLWTLLIFQAPVAGFNYLMMFHYFPIPHIADSLNIPGLGVLMIGLQLEGWACIGLLILQQAEAKSASVAQQSAFLGDTFLGSVGTV